MGEVHFQTESCWERGGRTYGSTLDRHFLLPGGGGILRDGVNNWSWDLDISDAFQSLPLVSGEGRGEESRLRPDGYITLKFSKSTTK